MDIASAESDHSRLMADVRALLERQSARNAADRVRRFEALRCDWALLRRQTLDRERLRAPRHNLIRFLDLTRSEIGFHSPFLRDLLDPYGTHGQGTLFLQAFLDMVAEKAHRDSVNWRYLWFDPGDMRAGEWVVLGESGKIDVSIRNRAQRVLIFIENKIGAQEQDKQLTRYRERLEEQRVLYEHRLLLFLSPRGYEPRSGRPDVKLTYEDDVTHWLGIVMTKVPHFTAPALYGNLLQDRDIAAGIQSAGEARMSN